MDVLHAPSNSNHLKIDEVWLFISVDAEGNEGVCAFQSQGMMVPMIAADEKILAHLEPIAKDLAKISPHPIKLIKLSHRDEVRIINP